VVNPNQPHPGTRVDSYRCSLPGLAEFTIYRCEGTHWGHHNVLLILTQGADYGECLLSLQVVKGLTDKILRNGEQTKH